MRNSSQSVGEKIITGLMVAFFIVGFMFFLLYLLMTAPGIFLGAMLIEEGGLLHRFVLAPLGASDWWVLHK